MNTRGSLLLLLTSVITLGIPSATAAPPASLQADPNLVEFGYLDTKQEASATVMLTNSGAAPIKIIRVRSDCECIKATEVPSSVAAGQQAKLKVQLIAPATPTAYDRSLFLFTDDAQQPKLTVRVKARVGLPLVATSQPVELGSLIAGEVRQGTAVIHNDGAQPVGLAYAISSEPSLVARVPRQSIPAQGTLAVPLEVKAAAAGEHKATVTFQTNSTTQPALPVAVRYAVDGGYAVSPGTIELGTLRPGQEGKATIRLTRPMGQGEPLIEKVDTADLKGIQCQATLRNEPGVGVVECTFTASGQSGPIQGQVSIHLKDRAQAVGVPVRGVVQDPTSQPASSPATAPAER